MIVSFYAAILGFILVLLSLKVINVRTSEGIALGNSNSDDLLRASRAQANFIEYVPIALFMMFLLEYEGVSVFSLHFCGIVLIISRVLHALSVLYLEPKYDFVKIRVIAMILTFSVVIKASILLLMYS